MARLVDLAIGLLRNRVNKKNVDNKQWSIANKWENFYLFSLSSINKKA